MPRLSLLRRTTAILLAAWVTAFQAEPAALHLCAAHDGGAHGIAAKQAPASHDAHAADAHVSHAAMGDGSAVADAPTSAPADHQACTCPGGCTVTATLALPEPGAALVRDVEVEARDSFTAIVAPAATDSEHLLPFANGPPSLV